MDNYELAGKLERLKRLESDAAALREDLQDQLLAQVLMHGRIGCRPVNLNARVLGAVVLLDKHVTIQDLSRVLPELNPASIRMTLSRLVQAGSLRRVSQGTYAVCGWRRRTYDSSDSD